MTDKPNRTPAKPDSEYLKLAGITAKGVLELAPGGGYLADLFKLRKELARDAVRKNDEETLDAFFSDLFDGTTALEPEIADAMINDRDFHSLLRACIADIEAEKRDAYAALARAIATRNVSGEWNRHFILSLKDMSLKELEFMRSAYVAKHFRLMPNSSNEGSTIQESAFLKAGQPGSFQSISINKLTNNGFVYEAKLSITGENFVKACTKNLNLSPAALGYKEWSNQNVAIISYELGDKQVSRQAMEISDLLWKYQIKSSIVAITRDNQQQVRMFNTQALLLLGQQSKALEEHASALAEYASKIPLLVLQISEKPASIPPGVAFTKMIEFQSDFNETLRMAASAILEFRNQPKTRAE